MIIANETDDVFSNPKGRTQVIYIEQKEDVSFYYFRFHQEKPKIIIPKFVFILISKTAYNFKRPQLSQ